MLPRVASLVPIHGDSPAGRPGYQVFWVLEGANGVGVMIMPDRDFQFTANPGSETELRFELRCD